MKLYFTASIVGKRRYLSSYEQIITSFKGKGHSVISDHIIKANEDDINMETPEERRAFHAKLENWITSADAVIAEVSFPSISVGFEISRALERGKAVLALYQEGPPPSLLPELNIERLIVEKYDVDSLDGVLEDFILYVEGHHESRFTFFLSPDLSVYLSEAAKRAGTPKSAYLRTLLVKDKQH